MKWRKYHAPHSGISAYAEGANYILIEFKTGERYRYDTAHPGKKHVQEMKSRAHRTSGLTTYINQHVRDNYAAKLRSGPEIDSPKVRTARIPPKRSRTRPPSTPRKKARRSSRAGGA